MNDLGICLIMLGAPFDNVKDRLYRRCRLFEEISRRFFLIIDNMPQGVSLNRTTIFNLNKSLPKHDSGNYIVKWILRYILIYSILQISMFKLIYKNRKDINNVFFATGIPHVLPLLIGCRFLRLKTIVLGGGTAYYSSIAGQDNIPLSSCIIWLPEQLCYYFTNYIAVETKQSARFLNLIKFNERIFVLGPLTYIDTDALHPISAPSDRKNIVGFISNLNVGKGILNLIKAEKKIAEKRMDVSFFIGGSGPLFNQINQEIKDGGFEDRFTVVGQIPHEDIGIILNQLKILVLPSYSEGLPTIILEAMATGTIVLVTPVGGIPDLIEHGVNGFILSNNHSTTIMEEICVILDYSELDNIAENAVKTIMANYSYQATLNRYRNALMVMNDK